VTPDQVNAVFQGIGAGSGEGLQSTPQRGAAMSALWQF